MHNGIFTTIDQVMNHYNLVPVLPLNTNLDPRLQGPGGTLQLTVNERNAIIAFLKTLSGNDVYTNEKWSNPFDENGNLEVFPLTSSLQDYQHDFDFQVYPNPSQHVISVDLPKGSYVLRIFSSSGILISNLELNSLKNIDISNLNKGSYFMILTDLSSGKSSKSKFVKL
jgi:cytochrome c peroxidase